MSFLDTIEHLQKKPRPLRMRLLVISVAVMMTMIVFVWVSSLTEILRPDTRSFDDSIRPFAVLGDILRDSFEGAKNQLKGLPQGLPLGSDTGTP